MEFVPKISLEPLEEAKKSDDSKFDIVNMQMYGNDNILKRMVQIKVHIYFFLHHSMHMKLVICTNNLSYIILQYLFMIE